MGDRTSCRLHLYRAELSADALIQIAYVIDDWGISGSDNNIVEIDDVNWGELNEEIHDTLKMHGVSYEWYWDAGGGYGSGVKIYDGETDESQSFGLLDGEIAITLDAAIKTPEIIPASALWANRMDGRPELDIASALAKLEALQKLSAENVRKAVAKDIFDKAVADKIYLNNFVDSIVSALSDEEVTAQYLEGDLGGSDNG